MSKLHLLQLEDEVHPVEIEASGTTANQEADKMKSPKSKKVKIYPAETHTMEELTEKTTNWTITAQLIRQRNKTLNNHMDILLATDESCMKGVIYSNLRKIFEDRLEEGKTYTISKAKIKEYTGLACNLPLKNIQMDFARNTEMYLREEKPMATPFYPLPFTTLKQAMSLPKNTVKDVDCIIHDDAIDPIVYSSEKQKKEILIYDGSCRPDETVTFEAWNNGIAQFEHLDPNEFYRMRIKDAKVSQYKIDDDKTISLSYTGEIMMTPVEPYTPHYNIICQWHKKKTPTPPPKADEKEEGKAGCSQHAGDLKNQNKEETRH